MEEYELLIIGAGPIGLACGLAAKKAGLRYLIVEKGTLVNSLYHYPVNMAFFSTSERLEIGGVPFVSNNAKPTRNEALEYYRRVAESGELPVRLFEVVLSITAVDNMPDPFGTRIDPDKTRIYEVTTSKAQYRARNIILATGFYDIAMRLDVPGEDLSKVTHYYKEPHFYYGQKVLVVGANNSAVDAALETYRKGAQVTMVIRDDQIGERVKYWVRPDIVNRIKEGSIKAYFKSTLREIRADSVDIQTPEGPITLENDYVIAATGYQPNLDWLRDIGIKLLDDEKQAPIYNPETQESNLPGIYLAGVVCGGLETHVWFIENSRVHAEQIVGDIIRSKRDAGVR